MAILLLITLLALAAPAGPLSFDAAADFSLTKNPNGPWQYGYSETPSLAPEQFRRDTDEQTVGVVGFWHPFTNKGPGAGYYPYVAFNTTKVTQFGSSNGWAVRADEVAMEGSNSGQYSLVRFTAPVPGRYSIEARFAGIHFGLSTTDVHVLHGAESLFDAYIDGYGGDPNFHRIQGAHPTANYAGLVQLSVGDTITFAVGYGQNKTHYSDTTGLSAKISIIE